ncbi:PcfK-like protein [Dysgonomonas alginatilytica]|uniref:PcfK-like protein n=1 Tax=Dysgonomonas alginatilytica TaxID=1605892 RepID=A0A2V3PSR2_9BACT|nr:PcfK-like family protein [Dysgonomonas alginatilytica]PXV68740.1 PcfK-like protein [Dysgonomonas alginatilytica]
MKSTDHFKNTIKAYLEERVASDTQFEWVYTKENKNIEDCITYILNAVQKSGCNGFTDEEIYSLAVHYYDEDNIEVGKPVNCGVVVNHTVVLTEEEKEEVRKEAIQKAHNEAYNRAMQPKKKAKRVEINNQPSLFDF